MVASSTGPGTTLHCPFRSPADEPDDEEQAALRARGAAELPLSIHESPAPPTTIRAISGTRIQSSRFFLELFMAGPFIWDDPGIPGSEQVLAWISVRRPITNCKQVLASLGLMPIHPYPPGEDSAWPSL